jgi:hypothetical protein
MEKLITLLQDLIDRYNITDEDVSKINDIIYGTEDEEGLYGDEYAAEDEEYSEEDEYED